MKDRPMTADEKVELEDFLGQVINNCNNESLLARYTELFLTQEYNEIKQEYFTVMIDRLHEEILRRMK